MNEMLLNGKIEYFAKTLQVPDFEDWVDYWRKDGAIAEKLQTAAKDAFDKYLRSSEINKKLIRQMPPFNNNATEEEVAAWNFSLRSLYAEYVYDLPNYLVSRDTVALEVITGKRANMRKFYDNVFWVVEDAETLLPIRIGSKEYIQKIYNEINGN